MIKRQHVYLIDLPTFPKGVISLSFPAISACLPNHYKIFFKDLNIENLSPSDLKHIKEQKCAFAGLKVSSQNHVYAIKLSQELKKLDPQIIIVWGGEYPSLLPEKAAVYADVVISGAFESIADEFLEDLEKGTLQKNYSAAKSYNCAQIRQPNYTILHKANNYLLSLGYPLETSRGCDKKCTFCMVHNMQPVNNYKTPKQLQLELSQLKNCFVNVVDYNIGSNTEHLNHVISAFTKTNTKGWTAELCLETIDDDTLLKKLAASGCRTLYCGLESVSASELKSINKARTNNIHNYSRIIKKAQSYGIQIAAGIIVGLEGASEESINETFRFYHDIGLIYAKITFLTFNPGTKVFQSMKRVGKYVTEKDEFFDGNHFTFQHKEVKRQQLIKSVSKNIVSFYSLKNIKKRAANAGVKGAALDEFVNYNLIYRHAYSEWLKYGIFENESGFKKLLEKKFKKTKVLQMADKKLMESRSKLTNKA